MAKKWIQKAIKKPGALHRQLGVPEGEKIPSKKMAAARAGKYGALAEKRAHLAKTLGSFETGGMVSQTGPYTLHRGETVIPANGSENEHSHVTRMTPLDMKRKELAEAKTMMEPAEREREQQTAYARHNKHVRPLGGMNQE